MLVYGQNPSNAFPAGSWPSRARVGGNAIQIIVPPDTTPGGVGSVFYAYDRDEMQPGKGEPEELVSAIAPIIHDLCP